MGRGAFRRAELTADGGSARVARAGVGHLARVDPDRVDVTNLHRLKNVPRNAREEGHEVFVLEPRGDGTHRLLLRKQGGA